MAQRYFKIEAIFGLIYRLYILIPYVDRTNETKGYIIKMLLNLYCEIFGTRSYGGDALASSCVFRHMNSCRILHNINSITYKYCTDTPVQSKMGFFLGI